MLYCLKKIILNTAVGRGAGADWRIIIKGKGTYKKKKKSKRKGNLIVLGDIALGISSRDTLYMSKKVVKYTIRYI